MKTTKVLERLTKTGTAKFNPDFAKVYRDADTLTASSGDVQAWVRDPERYFSGKPTEGKAPGMDGHPTSRDDLDWQVVPQDVADAMVQAERILMMDRTDHYTGNACIAADCAYFTDGHMVVRIRLPVLRSGFTLAVPPAVLKYAGHGYGDVHLARDESHGYLQRGELTLAWEFWPGPFPDFERVMERQPASETPNAAAKPMLLPAPQMMLALSTLAAGDWSCAKLTARRARSLVFEGLNTDSRAGDGVKCIVVVKVNLTVDDRAHAADSIPADAAIGFNPQLLLLLLKASGYKKDSLHPIALAINDPLLPLVLWGADEPSALLMPIRLD